jgi:hypothetical protein
VKRGWFIAATAAASVLPNVADPDYGPARSGLKLACIVWCPLRGGPFDGKHFNTRALVVVGSVLKPIELATFEDVPNADGTAIMHRHQYEFQVRYNHAAKMNELYEARYIGEADA